MTKSRSTKKGSAKWPGIKTLITATSLTVTIGGWAALARSQADMTDTASVDSPIALGPARLATDIWLAAPLLPTIVPPPQAPPQLAIEQPPVIPAALLHALPPSARQAAARQPAPAAAEPPAAALLPAASAPPLRVVSAPPPAPVAKTRSSR